MVSDVPDIDMSTFVAFITPVAILLRKIAIARMLSAVVDEVDPAPIYSIRVLLSVKLTEIVASLLDVIVPVVFSIQSFAA